MTLLEWLMLALGASIAGASKGGLPGLNTLAVVLFAQVLPAKVATGTLLPLLIVADLVAVRLFKNNANWRELWRIFPSAALGVVLGAVALGRMDDTLVRRLIGGLVVLLCSLQFWRNRNPQAGTGWVQQPISAAVAGGLAGFTTLIANAAGPIMTLYLLAMRLPKSEFVGTTAWFFLLVNLFKLPFMVGLGLVGWNSLALDAALLGFALVGVFLGRWVLGQLEQQRFNSLALGLAFLGGLRMLF
jgi:uncharacterized protein